MLDIEMLAFYFDSEILFSEILCTEIVNAEIYLS